MKIKPIIDEIQCTSREATGNNSIFNSNNSIEIRVFHMEMWWIMLIEIHVDDYSVKTASLWPLYSSSNWLTFANIRISAIKANDVQVLELYATSNLFLLQFSCRIGPCRLKHLRKNAHKCHQHRDGESQKINPNTADCVHWYTKIDAAVYP